MIDRRHFVRNLAYVAGAALFAAGNFYLAKRFLFDETSNSGEPRELVRYRVPDTINPPRIDEIAQAFSSGVPISEGGYAPAMIDLTHHVHRELFGMTYQDHIRKTFNNHNPIEVLVVENFLNRFGSMGRFEHGRNPGEVHRLYIEASAIPAQALIALVNGFEYGSFGAAGGNIVSAVNHRNISYMVAHFPELLRDDRRQCTLTTLMNHYISTFGVRNSDGKQRIAYARRGEGAEGAAAHIRSMITSNREFWTAVPGDTQLDRVVQFTINGYESLIPAINEATTKLREKGDLYVLRHMAKQFADVTEEYILRQNPNFPQDKKALLKRRMDEIRNYQFKGAL